MSFFNFYKRKKPGEGADRPRPLVSHLSYFIFFISSLSLSLLPVSCELLDYDLQGLPATTAASMNLEPDTIYVLVGDRFVLTPIFDPDTLSISDLYIYTVENKEGYAEDVEADDEGERGNSIIGITKDGLVARSPGWTTVYVESVSARLLDSCAVCVLEPWENPSNDYPTETIIYAEITVNGELPDEHNSFAAFVGSELRALGDYNTAYFKDFYIFRVRHSMPGDDTSMEHIKIFCYNAEEHKLYTASQWFNTDGESHGTPSNPVKIDFR